MIRPRIEKLGTFSAKPEDDIVAYLNNIELVGNQFGWTQDDIVRQMKVNMRGMAAVWASDVSHITSLASFKEAAKSQFGPNLDPLAREDYLRSCIQREDETVRNYLLRLREAAQRVGISTFTFDLTPYLIRGLRPELRALVYDMGAKNLNEAVEIAQRREQRLMTEAGDREVARRTRTARRLVAITDEDSEEGEPAFAIVPKSRERTPSEDDRLSALMKMLAEMKEQVTGLRKKCEQRGQRSGPRRFTCWHCKEPGHREFECPKKASEQATQSGKA